MDTVHPLVRRQNQGANRQAGGASVSAFVATLIPVGLLCLVYVTLFLVFRTKYRRIYEPRTYLGKFNENQRAPRTNQSLLGWVKDFYALPDTYVLNSQSIDGYLYLRFYKVITFIVFVGTLLTWVILFPVYATGNGGLTDFNLLSMSNISGQPNRYYASVFVSWIFFGFVMFVIARETLFYIHLRQNYLLSTRNASRISSRTVLYTDVPKEVLSEERIREIFPDVLHVWIATNTKDMEKLEKDRKKTALKLEAAECKLLFAANKERLKVQKKGDVLEDPMKWADEHKRPTHRLKPLIGQKVDTIDWCRNHLKELNPKIASLQEAHYNRHVELVPAVFIEFKTIQAAESAYQELPFHKPKVMQPRTIGTTPNEIIWENLSVPWWRRDIMYAVATALVCLLILLWTPLTVFAGLITNILYLEQISFLTWLSKVPTVITGLITGLLPSLIIVILMALVPIFLKMFAKFAGVVSTGEQQLMVQGWYFWFQFVIVFLITTFASGAASVGKEIANNPSSAPTLLAQNIPTASNFYISYFVLTGLSTFGGTLANIAALAVYVVLGAILDKTPRKKYNRYINISGISWGSAYPKYTTIAVIAIVYSMIAPLVLGFATVGLLLLYIAFRYELVYALDTNQMTTRGDTYRKALQQLTTGVYVAELCMIGIFAMDTGNHPAAAGPLILMIICFIGTILFHITMNAAFKPLLRGLPRDLLAGSKFGRATDTQLEMGELNHNGERLPRESNVSALGQDDATLLGRDNAMGLKGDETMMGSSRPSGWKGKFHDFLHPGSSPQIADFFNQPLDPYSEDQRKEAYVSPVVSAYLPLIWMPRDVFGGSEREKNALGSVTEASDGSAYWDDKTGKLRVAWNDDKDQDAEWEAFRKAPLYHEKNEW